MEYILSLLPVLACPIGMGLLLWWMMRAKKEQAPHERNQVPAANSYSPPVEVRQDSARGSSVFNMFGMCLNWKVLAGLAVVGVLVFVLAPQFIWVALPLLLVAACPLSMLFMMRGMSGGGSQCAMPPRQRSQSPAAELTEEERLAELKSHLSSLQAESEALASQIAEIERAEIPVLSEAEGVARAADERNRGRGSKKQ